MVSPVDELQELTVVHSPTRVGLAAARQREREKERERERECVCVYATGISVE